MTVDPAVGCQHSADATEDRIADLSVSAKLVYTILEYEGPLTQKEIIDQGWLHDRTARYAISDLKEADLIEERIYVRDGRQSLYAIAGRDREDDAG